ncbi:hypothetical protein B0G69_7993 [Paraburkholderia sp. RAU2J]|uniref:hypothetical protein n=1 Tax=Paraburkholderia sp. RAU2J TaxID=1938810 RepID=UPI000EAF5629|nr:hypothetical protein [Paraburkholderia sp. RAU2J]RKT10565.1 hypothetical protein B0G69_7993 [Paraburkholderia sp. RAU2J]
MTCDAHDEDDPEDYIHTPLTVDDLIVADMIARVELLRPEQDSVVRSFEHVEVVIGARLYSERVHKVDARIAAQMEAMGHPAEQTIVQEEMTLCRCRDESGADFKARVQAGRHEFGEGVKCEYKSISLYADVTTQTITRYLDTWYQHFHRDHMIQDHEMPIFESLNLVSGPEIHLVENLFGITESGRESRRAPRTRPGDLTKSGAGRSKIIFRIRHSGGTQYVFEPSNGLSEFGDRGAKFVEITFDFEDQIIEFELDGWRYWHVGAPEITAEGHAMVALQSGDGNKLRPGLATLKWRSYCGEVQWNGNIEFDGPERC